LLTRCNWDIQKLVKYLRTKNGDLFIDIPNEKVSAKNKEVAKSLDLSSSFLNLPKLKKKQN
jgi:hypothetical protein